MKDDVALVTDALEGDTSAFGPIVERYQDAVFGVALARLRNFHDAEDMAQSVFVEAFERLSGLKDASRLGAWLRSITIHRCLDRVRQRGRWVDFEAIDEPCSDVTPHVTLERQEVREQVMDAIGRLSKKQRETVTLFYMGGYSQQEIATIQEVPVSAIKTRLFDARKRLKKDMMVMVEDVLKDGAPTEDFSDQVFKLLCAYPDGSRLWSGQKMAQLAEIGAKGKDGFAKALQFSHWRTRHMAAHYLSLRQKSTRNHILPIEDTIALLKQALSDPNRGVRRTAAFRGLLRLDVPEERKKKEFIPVIAQLLFDPSKTLRCRVSKVLCQWASAVPLMTVVEAIATETEADNLIWMQKLLKAILEAQKI